jgi:hypothetical protein
LPHFFTLALSPESFAQTTAFTYQGRLTDAGSPADGIFDLQFKLFDTPDAGTGLQQGSTVVHPTVQVTRGVFAVLLDFGPGVFNGSARYLEISLRPAGSPDARVTLEPRQPITYSPYAVRSASAAAAETATNATQLGGITASGFIQNMTAQQSSTNFNISGNGTAGGTLVVSTLGSAGSAQLCRNVSNQVSSCSSSLRYKTNVQPFNAGLDLVRRLRPIIFD